MATLKITDLHASINGKLILKGINLTVNTGELHALLGPNGHGKSTLLSVIMGHPKYEVVSGSITLDGEDVLAMSVDQRARAGLFLGMQHPLEVPGVTVSDFLRLAVNSRQTKPVSLPIFIRSLEKATNSVGFPLDMVHRGINEGFSGGEKKRNEVLQMIMMKPKIAMMDEIDSGLDVDSLKLVANAVNSLRGEAFGCLIVSHYARLYSLVKPTHVHVIVDGRIITTGDHTIIDNIDRLGYDWIRQTFGVEITKEEEKPAVVMNAMSIGACAVKEPKAKGSKVDA